MGTDKTPIATLCKSGYFICPTVAEILSWIISTLIYFAALTTFIFLIIGGVKYITSGGDSKQVQAAKHTLTNAIIGLTITLLSFAIIKLIGTFLDIDLLLFPF